MAAQTYTIINNSPTDTAVVNYITIDTNVAEMQHHLNLLGWDEPFNSSYTDFQGATTLITQTKTYVSDVRPINRTYVSNTGTYVHVGGGTVSGIGTGWAVSGNHFTSGQTVLGTSGTTWVHLSAPPDSLPPVGEVITFTPPSFLLTLDNITGIGVGWAASGAGYSGQTVISTTTGYPNTLEMSGYSSLSSPSGNITFTSNGDIMISIPPLGQKTFVMDYNNVTTSLGTYTSNVNFHITQGGILLRQVNNFMFISSAPVTDPSSPFYDGGAGGAGGAASSCADSSSASCSANGGSCFTGNTKITMADGTAKAIAELKIGDLVLDAFENKSNKVIGIKTMMVPVGSYLFSPREDTDPFMTEEHPFYDSYGNLCAISSMAETLAPWLGSIKIVDVHNKYKITESFVVYNIMFERGNTHYANGVKVNNIVGTGNSYVLYYKGYIDRETYLANVRAEDRVTSTRAERLAYYSLFKRYSDYVLYNDNLLSKIIAKLFAHQLKYRTKYKPVWETLFKSRLYKHIRSLV